MPVSANVISQSVTLAPSQWLMSKRQDWVWLLGGALGGYAMIGLLGAGAPLFPFALLMLLVLEGPHVFATATRSYLDPIERKRLGWFLWLIIPFCLLGPALVLAGYSQLFYLFAISWLHFHIAKQHLGFVLLYKRKAGERGDYYLDKYFLLGSLTLPLIGFWIHKYFARSWPLWPQVVRGAIAVYLVCVAIYLWRQCRKSQQGRLATPKLYLMGLVIPLQWLAFAYAARSPRGLEAAGVVISFCHTLQYHRLTWLYHQTAQAVSSPSPEKSPLWFRLSGYLFVVLSLNLILNVVPRGFTDSDLAFAAIWGLPFMHFALDGRMWKTKDYPVLKQALRLA
jgi:hypothetical protein